jgi:V8-like Glu-specific endopeptidase
MSETKSKNPRRATPLHPDEIARRENVCIEPPEDFLATGKHKSLVFSDKKGRQIDAARVLKRAKATKTGLRLEAGVIEGLVASAYRSDDIPDVVGEAPPAAPDWGGRMYHPRLAAARSPRRLRRFDGSKTVTPNRVVGSDDRTVYYPSGYPWHCIGRVYVSDDASAGGWSWTGSAALISNNAILTAGHVVPWGASSWRAKFVPAHYDGTSIYGVGFERWITNAHGYNSSGSVTGYDAAVMRLASPLELGYFGSKVYSGSWNDEPYWRHCGYAGMVSGTRPNYQAGISVHDTDSDSPGLEVEHNGDVTPGDSGGPLFAWWEEGPYIVGTHSGEETEYHFPFSFPRVNVDAGGNALNNLVSWARANW